jgi:putative nucleotidyltransferase with HDIG domain
MGKLDEFIKIAEEAMLKHRRVEGGYGYEFYHGLRVMKLSKEIAESEELRMEKINEKCLLVGALFHDVGKAMDSDNHAEAGVEFTKKNLSHLLDEHELAVVSEIIRQHCQKRKETVEARIVSDADCIDHVGVMDVWRMFHYSAFERRSPTYTIRWFSKNKEWLMDHIKKVSFEVSRKEMRERIKIELKLMKEFEREAACRLGRYA